MNKLDNLDALASQVKKKETAKERREREAVERETERLKAQAEALEAWPSRLMANLERATKQSWSIYVSNGRFVVDARSSWGDTEEKRFGLTPVGHYNTWGGEGDWDSMEELERLLNDAEEAEREAQRKYAIRQGAIAKLTPEERKELGL